MSTWPSERLLAQVPIEHPLIQAPMAGAQDSDMAIAATQAGGLGSLPCGMLSTEQAVAQGLAMKEATAGLFNMNFLCHEDAPADPGRDEAWRASLGPYYDELAVAPPELPSAGARRPFDHEMCEVVEALSPAVVSFHFGLPDEALMARVRATGAKIWSSATTVIEARWLEANGCDAIIAQGLEAGGHRGMFLTADVNTQLGTMALVPQVVDAVQVPVIAAGGVVDGRGVHAAFALGADAVQMGSAFLRTTESRISDLHRGALAQGEVSFTALTNVFSGRPARGLMNRVMRERGPLTSEASAFPLAGAALAPLKAAAEQAGSTDFTSLWSGQNLATTDGEATGTVLARIAADALARLGFA